MDFSLLDVTLMPFGVISSDFSRLSRSTSIVLLKNPVFSYKNKDLFFQQRRFGHQDKVIKNISKNNTSISNNLPK